MYKLDLPPLYSRIHPVFHVSLLELVQVWDGKMPGMVTLLELTEDSGKEEWEIELIVDHCEHQAGVQYLVCWKGWSKEYDKWVHEGFLTHAPTLIQEYCACTGLGLAPQAAHNSKQKRGPTT